jgi:hypothetical protein
VSGVVEPIVRHFPHTKPSRSGTRESEPGNDEDLDLDLDPIAGWGTVPLRPSSQEQALCLFCFSFCSWCRIGEVFECETGWGSSGLFPATLSLPSLPSLSSLLGRASLPFPSWIDYSIFLIWYILEKWWGTAPITGEDGRVQGCSWMNDCARISEQGSARHHMQWSYGGIV